MTGYTAKVGLRKPKTLIPALRGQYRNAELYELLRYGIALSPDQWQHVLNWGSAT